MAKQMNLQPAHGESEKLLSLDSQLKFMMKSALLTKKSWIAPHHCRDENVRVIDRAI